LVCKAEFEEKDDIVVCPDCGLPYHRACFAENGDCAHEAFGDDVIEDIFDEDEKFEERFEKRLADIFTHAKAKQILEDEEDFEQRGIFGVSKAELSAFMRIERGSIDYKVKIEQLKVINVNIFAWLFVPFYQFCKGMRLFGFAVLIPLFLQFVPYFYMRAGMENEFLLRFGSSPEQFHSTASTFTTIVMLGLVFFNDYIYLRFAAYKIRRIRCYIPAEEQSGVDYYDYLRFRGTPNIMRGIIETLAAIFLLIMAMNVLI
jgi:hypothetical protein